MKGKDGRYYTVRSCCWKEGGIVAPPTTKCQTCAWSDVNKPGFVFDCNPVYISHERPIPSPTLPGTNDELADPGTGQTPQPPTQTFPGGDIFGSPPGEVANPDAGQNPQPPTGTSPRDDIFAPPDKAADPGAGQTPDDDSGKEDGGKGKTFLGDDVFTPPDKAADPGTGQNSDDNNGNKGSGVGRPDIGATGPEVGEVKPNLPSTGDGGSGVVG